MATYTKTISLINKVFSWENVLILLDAISKSAESIPNAVHCISVTCEDNFNVKYDSVQEFSDSKINNYNILRLCSMVRSNILNIELHLHTNNPNLAEIKISGSEEQMVYALAEKIKEIKQLIKPQRFTYFTHNLGIKASGLFALISFLIFFIVKTFFIGKYIDILLIGIVGVIIGLLSVKFANWMCATYPAVEFEFIPDWKNVIKKRRSQMKWWFAAILLPMFLAATWDCIKLLWQRGMM